MPFASNKEIIEKVRRIKILSKRLTENHLAGDFASAFRGTGLDFDQLREYQFGDDVRFIDWNASAKNDVIMLKEFVPERDRSIILAVDCSASMAYSSKADLKQDVALLTAAALSYIATSTHDKVGLLAFSGKGLVWLPPQRGRLVFTKILDTLCLAMQQGGTVNIQEALKFLLGNVANKSVVFLISDWIDQTDSYTRELKILARKHESVVVRVLDPVEHAFPDCGLVEIEDPETHERFTIDASANKLSAILNLRVVEQRKFFDSCGLETIDLQVGDQIDRKLANFFHSRTRRYKK